jgi:protein-L-isoaspartate(D-aspartate) O-methyltransferase
MITQQIRARGIQSQKVLDAMASVPRHLFVPQEYAFEAYADEPLSIGQGQTISQPYIVAAMTEALALEGDERVLEIGAGSGYQAAVLSHLAKEVIAVEIDPSLASEARKRLGDLGYQNIQIVLGDGSLGYPDLAPYPAILVAAGAPSVPPPLIEQLAEGGRLVIPVGAMNHQELVRFVKQKGRLAEETICGCRFVPLTGQYGWKENTSALDAFFG